MTTSAEASPRALRIMSLVRWALLAIVAMASLYSFVAIGLGASGEDDGVARFYCPMHPDITSPRPGTCPICHMTLEPIPTHGESTSHERSSSDDAGPDEAGPPSEELAVGAIPSGTQAVMLSVERLQSSGLVVVPARRALLRRSARWPAVVEALEGARAEVRVRAPAYVERSEVRELGAHVRRGAVLAWVSAPEILAAEQELLTAERLRLAGGRGEDDPIRAAARRRLELLGATASEIDAVLRAGEPRRRIALRAPIDGTITRLDAVVGAYASPETVLFEVTSFARVRVVASVFDRRDLALLEGGEASFVGQGDDDTRARLELEWIEPELAADTRATRVRFSVDDRELTLRPGTIGDVTLDAGGEEAVLVPRDAILDRGTARYVFVETEPGVFTPRVVRVGRAEGDEREVEEGLAAGERVVQRGAFLLDSESRLSAALSARAPSVAAGGAAPRGPAEHAHEGSP